MLAFALLVAGRMNLLGLMRAPSNAPTAQVAPAADIAANPRMRAPPLPGFNAAVGRAAGTTVQIQTGEAVSVAPLAGAMRTDAPPGEQPTSALVRTAGPPISAKAFLAMTRQFESWAASMERRRSPSPSAEPIAGPAAPPGMPGNTAATPAPGGGAPRTVITPGPDGSVNYSSSLTPGDVEMQKLNSKMWATTRASYATEASEAVQANTLLEQIKNESQTWTSGSFATWCVGGEAWLDTLGRMVGMCPNVSVGDYQVSIKKQLAATATRAISKRPAAIEFTQLLRVLLNPKMTPQGISQVTSMLQGINDWKIVRAALAARYDGTANPTQFGSDYTNPVPIAPFILNRLPVADAAALHNTLMKTPAGRATWHRIWGEYNTTYKAGLFNLLPGSGS